MRQTESREVGQLTVIKRSEMFLRRAHVRKQGRKKGFCDLEVVDDVVKRLVLYEHLNNFIEEYSKTPLCRMSKDEQISSVTG